MQWLARLKWVVIVILGFLTACQAGGRSMQASELFEPPMAALLQSIRNGDEAAAQRQLSQGLDLNIQGKEGITPLLWLVYETQNKKAVRLALKLGANPNYKDGSGDSIVNRVSGVRDPDWLRIVLDAGGDPNSIGRLDQPAIFSAINEERWSDIKLLVERGADVNLEDGQKRNSAHYAAYLDLYDIVYWLIEQGADTTIRDRTGSDLAFSVEDSLATMSPQSPQYTWALKVKQLLQQRGVKFPPLSPAEVRERRAKGEPL
ncbi:MULTISPECIES: ankyrin repeat domain-containing protein [Brenneria]|uniref:Ankyrin repeat domain-containing protein n=1 Tax=Brenneria nigrifluens DSM 30175 = ATCC 13028 TaxID=1121120 RepID=A0A2U1UA74_9GAMM|nr:MULTISPECIES: ankyrin repeat domain-containing protein [Brenneria]EHD20420.1 Ankyrin [Brenneria sp. EniD312]PWC18568.1 ankyrin repeat domain-containing protein [Brenneria nigrifluens DSM 30175 = ATCC 13028]QCR03623.1 ankyrin repeat domain-containing protein [Brenneria nigrifluens DSM 30175 = ATCC 13028]